MSKKRHKHSLFRLITAHPEIKHLWKFSENLSTEEEMKCNKQISYHGKRLLETINVILKSLDDLSVIDIILRELGARHFVYGCRAEYLPVCQFINFFRSIAQITIYRSFKFIQDAFLLLLEEQIGCEYNKEVEGAWVILLTYVKLVRHKKIKLLSLSVCVDLKVSLFSIRRKK